jgi:hypothetical protein
LVFSILISFPEGGIVGPCGRQAGYSKLVSPAIELREEVSIPFTFPATIRHGLTAVSVGYGFVWLKNCPDQPASFANRAKPTKTAIDVKS